MSAAGTNKPEGSRYNKLFGTWLKNHGFDDIDESDRKRLFDVARAPLRDRAVAQVPPPNLPAISRRCRISFKLSDPRSFTN
jgi:hypothetical protein